ncbi:MAG: hypothetical protein HXO68_04585, partial [Rothia sp.]|nr:hypothetical protein [Rothia sp. (in: high G+C Gram-positive bacteria)]
MTPTSDPAHESQIRIDPEGHDDTVETPDNGEERIEPVQKTSVLVDISFCLGVGLMLVYAGLDAHQALASAGHGWDIVSIFTIAVPRLLSGTIWVELIILCFLAVLCTGSRGARQTLMLYAAVCCLSGMLITAGSFDLAGFFFPAFTALNPATSPATASLTVTKVLVIIVGVGAALFIFLLGLVSTRDEDVVLSEEPPAPAAEGAKNVAGADEEAGMTIEERQAAHYLEMLRLIDEEERVTRTPAEQRILDLRAKMAVTENPLEKQRLEGEILLTLRAERAGLEPYDGELDGDEPVDDELVDDEPVDEENVLSHQSADAETRARLEEAQAHREEEEANRRAEEAVAQQYETARRKAGRK